MAAGRAWSRGSRGGAALASEGCGGPMGTAATRHRTGPAPSPQHPPNIGSNIPPTSRAHDDARRLHNHRSGTVFRVVSALALFTRTGSGSLSVVTNLRLLRRPGEHGKPAGQRVARRGQEWGRRPITEVEPEPVLGLWHKFRDRLRCVLAAGIWQWCADGQIFVESGYQVFGESRNVASGPLLGEREKALQFLLHGMQDCR